jgi:hypothetical protein
MRGPKLRLGLASCVLASLAALSVTLAAGSASAQGAPPPPPPPAPPAPPPPEPPPATVAAPGEPASGAGSANDVRYRDANADRVILGSTAETHPKGTFYFSDYEILLLQFGYAVTDEVQLQLTGVPPIIKDQPYWFELGGKVNLYRGDAFRAAITGGLDIVTPGGTGANVAYGGRLGAIGQICFNGDGTCRSSLSLSLGSIITSEVIQALPI